MNEKLLSQKARRIVPYVAGEQPADKRYIKLNTNENPYPPSPKAAEALRSFCADSLRLYPSLDSAALIGAIAKAEGVSRDRVFVGNGSDEVLALAFAALFDDVVFCDITYSFYPVFCEFSSVRYRTLPLKEDFTVDIDAFCGSQAGGIVLANPNAPTSIELPIAQIERIVRANPDIPVIIDEAYIDFASCGSCVPLTEKYDNLLVVKTVSKSYSLAGIRCGWAVGSSTLIDGLRRMRDSFNSYPVDSVCQAVCAAAIADGEYYRTATDKVIKARTDAARRLADSGVHCPPSGANFLFVPVPGGDGEAAYRYLRDNGVLVRYFNKPRLSDKLRVTVGTAEQTDAFVRVFEQYIKLAPK